MSGNLSKITDVTIDLICGGLSGMLLGFGISTIFLGHRNNILIIISLALGICGGFYNIYKKHNL